MNDDNALILVVDDDNETRQVIGKLLDENHFSVAFAESGAEVFDLLEDKCPELILLDIMMPHMDGYEVCRKIKSNEKTADIPVIFLTAKSQTLDLVQGFEAGGIDYVTKPYESLELLVRINTHIKLRRTLQENAALRGILPICANCKKIRDDHGKWENVDQFIHNHTTAKISHGLCPDCASELYGDSEWFRKENLPD